MLNIEQQKVAMELDKNILLLASAGTGKTDILSKRIANIINQGKANPKEILCITFTNKACREMKSRVEEIVAHNAKDITIKTFHGFCFDIIKEQAKKKTDIFTDFIIFDEEDCKELIGTLNYFNFPVGGLKSFIDLVKGERIKMNKWTDDFGYDIEKIIKHLFLEEDEKINNICSEKRILNYKMKEYLRSNGKDLVIAYNQLLNSNHGLDFNDLISNAKNIFRDENVVKYYKEKFKFINIDEMQDTSLTEYSIIEEMFEGNNILLCGDKFQTIYQWRGSNPNEIFERYINKYKPIEVVFNKNYRATKNLTKASLGFLKNSFEEEVNSIYKDGVEAESLIEGEKISLAVKSGVELEAKYIKDEIDSLLSAGNDISKTCILTRDNKYNIELSKVLKNCKSEKYDFVLVDQFRFFRRQEIKDIVAFLKLIANRNDSISLKRILDRLPSGIGNTTLNEIDSKEYKEIGIRLSDYIDSDVINYGEKYALLLNELGNDNVIIFDVESTGVNVTEDEIIQIAAIRLNKDGKVIERFERFLKNNKSVKSSQFVHGFSDEFLNENGEDKEKVFKEFKEFSKDAVIVGHNVQYDINILTSELERLGIEKPSFKGVFDTLDIYRRFYPKAPNYKLITLSKIFETENDPTHNAMNDILATGELLIHAVKEYIRPTSLKRIAFMTAHLRSFNKIVNTLNDLFKKSENMRVNEIIAYIMNEVELKNLYRGDTAGEKLERLRDFYSLISDLDEPEKSNRDSLLDIIKLTGLSNGEIEELIIKRGKKIRIPIITVHQSKGLEFDNVFLAGIQEETFPSYMAIKNDSFEEEKRTFYVAMTRAKKRLYITSNTKGLYNRYRDISRFIELIPREYIKNIK